MALSLRKLEEKIHAVDWQQYVGPEYYKPSELTEALVHLVHYDESRAPHGLDNKMLFALGNNHAGTYYPAILEALGIIIEIEAQSENPKVTRCAQAILNNLYYFEAEVGTYVAHSSAQIEAFVRSTLTPYADKPELSNS